MTLKIAPASEDIADREIIVTRIIDAPRERVREAMIDPEQAGQWWRANGFTTSIEEMNVRPGAVWKHIMHGLNGTDYTNSTIAMEGVKPERIAHPLDDNRTESPGIHFLASWSFESLGTQTRITLSMLLGSAADRDIAVNEYGAIEGGNQTLQRLAQYLSSDRQ